MTGCNRAFVIDREIRERLIARDPACAAWIRPFLKGRDLGRWSAEPSERYLLVHERGRVPPKALRAHLAPLRAALEPGTGRKPGNYRWYELQDPVGALAKSVAPRLFYQDIQTAPVCALDRDGFVPDTTVWILETDDRFLLALLNSRLYGWYARRRFPPALNRAVRPKREYMMKLPIAQPAPALRARIIELADAQLIGPTAARDRELDALICRAYRVSASLIT
ncbi:MAG: TaqI-like C-terminal specificity domain-containing protein [Kofleriaceae bacterium]